MICFLDLLKTLNSSGGNFFYHTGVLNAEVNSEMPRMKSKAVLGGNDPVFQAKSGLGELTMEGIRRMFSEELGKSLDRWTNHFDHERRLEDKESNTNQC